MNDYNGYSGSEREAKLRAMNRLRREGHYGELAGPCAICCDPDARVEPHSEDYSKPYLWEPPAEYPLCLACHRMHLHKRFDRPDKWHAFKAHVRRGGYAREWKDKEIQREIRLFLEARARGEAMRLRQLRTRSFNGDEWWERLTLDPASLTAAWARPRP